MTNSDDGDKSSENKVKKEKDVTAKQPLRTLPMRQARINAASAVSEQQIRDIPRVLRSKPSTSSSSPASSTKDKSIRKSSRTSRTSTPTSTRQVDNKKGTEASTSAPRRQHISRRPSLRAARRRIKAKNIKARSSKCQLFFCDKCDKVYDHYSELVYHQRRHTGEKPFACSWPGCTAAFSASNARVRHMRIHTGEKPYVCPHSECGRRFTYWKDLKLHKLRHSGEKPHKCTWPGCSSRFFRRDDLKHHRYTHTGEKPYKCTFPGCESAFTQKSPLNLHMRKIHKILPDSTKPSDNSQSSQIEKNISVNNCDGVVSSNISTSCEYSVYPTVPDQPISINQLQIADTSHIHQNNHNNVANNMMYINSNQMNDNVQCMTVADKLSSILVTCDVSPATVHGVSHQFNQDVNGWSNYAYVSDTVTCNQNLPNMTRPMVDHRNSSSCMKEPNVVVSKPVEHNLNHIHNLDDLLADACAASQIPMDNQVNITNSNNSPLDCGNRIENSEFLMNEANCGQQASLLDTNSVNTCPSTMNCSASSIANIETCRSTVIVTTTTTTSTSTATTATSTDEITKQASNNTTASLVEVAPDLPSATLMSTKEIDLMDASKKDKQPSKTKDTGKTTQDTSTSPTKSIRPVRKRANYRMKTPEIVKKSVGVVAIIRQKPMVETKSTKKKSAIKIDKFGAKRTIAIQTTKRQHVEKTKDGKFKCDYCEREFKAKHDRDCHHMTHTGEKPRACDWPGCDYRCITKSKLTRHQRKHTGERNYPCDWPGCGKAFSTGRHQKEHKRTHTGEKPFKCDFPGCDKWFARKDHIKNHRFTHTGEKPRKCSYPGCEAAFIQLSPLKKHMELHKRDNGPVPNRTRKRKTGSNALSNEESNQSIIVNECLNNANTQINNSNNVIINTNPIQLDAMTLEMVTSRMISQHNPPVQAFNMLVQQAQENQNVCLTSYESNSTINHTNNQQVNLDYEVMFRHPSYT